MHTNEIEHTKNAAVAPSPSSALTPEHRAALERRGIAPEIISGAGVTSVTATDPRLAPFRGYQRSAGMLIPIFPPDGSNSRYQIKHDVPRKRQDGSEAKYEPPEGQKHRLYIYPGDRAKLKDVSIPIFPTEGVFKALALASRGVLAVAGAGVDCFLTAECLKDWELIDLTGRLVYITFDSDYVTNPNVRRALDRLAAFLVSKGATVRIITVPPGPNGEKMGVDDYLGAGGDLLTLVAGAEDWRPSPMRGGGDGAEACRQCAERLALEQAEATVLASPKIKSHRKVPFLLWLRRVHSDLSRARHPTAVEGEPDNFEDELPLADEDGFVNINLKYWGKEIGYGEAALRDAKNELIALGILMPKSQPFLLASGLERERVLVRPKDETLLASIRRLASIDQASKRGGEREGAGRPKKTWQCADHPDSTLHRACDTCGAPATLTDAPLVQVPMNDFESQGDEDPSAPSPFNVIQTRAKADDDPGIQTRSQGGDDAALRDDASAVIIGTGICPVHDGYVSYRDAALGACSRCDPPPDTRRGPTLGAEVGP
jgi:hypothetical protein